MRPIGDCKRFVIFSHSCDFVFGTSTGEDVTATLQPMLQVPRLRAASILGIVVPEKQKHKEGKENPPAIRPDIPLA